MSVVLEAQPREMVGKRNNRRLRAAGSIPVVLYGHGTDAVSLAISTVQFETALRQGTHVVDLAGCITEKALIREIQYDVYGVDVLHVDFTRVSADERVEITLAVLLRGEAAGSKEGGTVQQVTREVAVECQVVSIPDSLSLRVNDLKLDESLLASDIELPEGVQLVTPAETVIARCSVPVEAAEEEEGAEASGDEPQVIGDQKEDGDASDEA